MIASDVMSALANVDWLTESAEFYNLVLDEEKTIHFTVSKTSSIS